MLRIEDEHTEVEVHLTNIKATIDEMFEEGLGGEDFASLYVTSKLIPSIYQIFNLEK